jgi:hypothetical protein
VAATLLSASDVHAVNTFDHPDAVAPRPATAPAAPTAGQPTVFTFPAASVTKLDIALGS